MRVVGYVRDRSIEPSPDGDAPEQRIRALAAVHEWEVLTVIHDRDDRCADSAGDGLAAALDVLARDADALAVTALDHLSGSLAQVTDLLERFDRNGWVLILANGGADVLRSAQDVIRDLRASREADRRRKISARTREAIERKRAAGGRIGGPRRCPGTRPELRRRAEGRA